MSSLIYHPLASGSKGNLTFLAYKNTRILIDVGLPIRQLMDRLNKACIDPATIDAILLTHEHTDHIGGLEPLLKRYPIPVLCTQLLAQYLLREKGWMLPYKIFSRDEMFTYGDIEVDPFPISHDAVDPVGFVFTLGGIRIGHCTDLGFVSSIVAKKLTGCHVLLIESNHDEGMVYASSRPDVYKRRVLSRQGHLSNEASAALVAHLIHPDLQKVYLGHLSEECNVPKKALEIHKNTYQADQLDLEAAPQHESATPFIFKKPAAVETSP